MNLLEIKAAQDKVAKEFLESVPYDAWRLFGRKEDMKFDGQFFAFSEHGDMWQIGDVELRTCLDFWVKQAGGEVTWKK